jgi:hypothetical protein
MGRCRHFEQETLRLGAKLPSTSYGWSSQLCGAREENQVEIETSGFHSCIGKHFKSMEMRNRGIIFNASTRNGQAKIFVLLNIPKPTFGALKEIPFDQGHVNYHIIITLKMYYIGVIFFSRNSKAHFEASL